MQEGQDHTQESTQGQEMNLNLTVTEITVILSKLCDELDQGFVHDSQPFWNFHTLLQHQSKPRNQLMQATQQQQIQTRPMKSLTVRKWNLICHSLSKASKEDLEHSGMILKHNETCLRHQSNPGSAMLKEQCKKDNLKAHCQKLELALSEFDAESFWTFGRLMDAPSDQWNLWNTQDQVSKQLEAMIMRNHSLLKSQSQNWQLAWPFYDPELTKLKRVNFDDPSGSYDLKEAQNQLKEKQKAREAKTSSRMTEICRKGAWNGLKALRVIYMIISGYYKYG